MAADDGSVAPKERVNIVYKTETGGMQEQLELPLRLLVMGDFTGRKDSRPVEKREAIEIDKDNLEEVLSNLGIRLDFDVEDVISGIPDKRLRVALDIANFGDFGPDAIARQVPELRQLLEMRAALVELKAPIDENDEFRSRLQTLLDDHDQRRSLLEELEVGTVEEKP